MGKSNQIKAFIFDMDGTIVNNVHIIPKHGYNFYVSIIFILKKKSCILKFSGEVMKLCQGFLGRIYPGKEI